MARGRDRLERTAEEAKSSGAPEVAIESVDIRDTSAVDRAFSQAAERLGPVDGLIANSGIGGANADGPDDRFEALVQTNLVGTYRCLRAAQRHLAPGPQARHLIVISSILGRIGVPGYTGYCASKTALLGLTRALAMEVASDNIHVNAICPGWVDTEMAWEGIEGFAAALSVSRDEAYAKAMSAVPMGKMSSPEEIAGLVAFLLSADANGMTGQGIDMNNGAYMI
jgi:NAD(P)-dependent dehydrogenase (short-subunit alcohol dehydrogenase family)